MTRRCALFMAGLNTYEQGLNRQQRAWDAVAAGQWDGALILLEHYPVITLGRDYQAEELLWPLDVYKAQGIALRRCNRGGKITCHNPGQLVGYPILNLAKWQRDSHWYLRALEEVIMLTVQSFGLLAERKQGYTGVWVDGRKIAAIGVNIRRWITGHGFALNVYNDLSIFSSVVPCGIKKFGVTSLAQQGIRDVSLQMVSEVLTAAFERVFKCSLTAQATSREGRCGSERS